MDIACTLTSPDLAVQRERWLRLIHASGTGRAQTMNGLRLEFRADPGVAEELEQLAAVERGCCAWASWSVTIAGDRVELDVTSAGDGVVALHAMFTESAAH
ncbi:MAG TPA: hypothetical protein VGI72_10095 [Gaiellales bacterium]|jgi:hypothetical protein